MVGVSGGSGGGGGWREKEEIAEEEVQRSSTVENLGIRMSFILFVFFLFVFLAIFIPASAQKKFITALMHRHFFRKIEA